MIRPEPGRARPVYTIPLAYRIAEAHELRALESRQLSLVIARCSAKSKALAGQSGSKSGSRKLNTGGSSMRCASLQVISVSQWLCRSNLRGERVGCSGPEQVGPLSGTERQALPGQCASRASPDRPPKPYQRPILARVLGEDALEESPRVGRALLPVSGPAPQVEVREPRRVSNRGL